MKDSEIVVILVLLVPIAILGISVPMGHHGHHGEENVIFSLEKAIADSVEAGNYRCCIDPPCKMCYLGNWIFEQEECGCDDLIAQGRFEEVCPECKHGMEQGECESVSDSCAIDI